jgi:hypothetical protein
MLLLSLEVHGDAPKMAQKRHPTGMQTVEKEEKVQE